LVGVLSDSHDDVPLLRRAVGLLRNSGVEHLVHAGDIAGPAALQVLLDSGLPVTAVFGNCDGVLRKHPVSAGTVHPGPHVFSLDGRRLALVHDMKSLAAGVRDQVDVVVHGHTHKAAVESGPPLMVNPGEVGGRVTGRVTVALLDLEALEAATLKV
jgi:putative phosphoesterase